MRMENKFPRQPLDVLFSLLKCRDGGSLEAGDNGRLGEEFRSNDKTMQGVIVCFLFVVL